MTQAFSDREGAPVDLLAESEMLFRDMAEEMALALRRFREGDFSEAKGASAAAKDLRAAYHLVMDERTRVEKLRKQVAGVVHDYALDFDAARDEIGRRLARLREAGGG